MTVKLLAEDCQPNKNVREPRDEVKTIKFYCVTV